MLSKLNIADMNTDINTSDAEKRVIIIDGDNKDTEISMLQVFQAATTKEEYLTNMAKLILAMEIQDYRGVRKFCGD